MEQTGNKIQAARKYLLPPLVTYTNTVEEAGPTAGGGAETGASSSGGKANAAPKFSLFAYMLVGMAGMFLLMLASQGMTDLYREVFKRTFERYHTLHERLLPFVAGKALFTVVIVSLGAVIMLAGGQWLFGFRWPRPMDLGGLTLAYICFATGLMSLSVAIMRDEQRANALNNVLSMMLSMAGGCMFPPDQFPAAVREYLCPLLPTYWYATTARELWWGPVSWWMPAAKLAAAGALCLGLAAFLFKRRFQQGVR